MNIPINMIEQATKAMREMSIKDSGERTEFESGAVRDTQKGKPRIDLIPPEVLHELGMHYAEGAEKYSERNWEKGQPIDRYVASMDRHWNAWKMGETDEPHLRAAIWNLMAIMHHEIMIRAGRLPESLIGVFGVLANERRDRHDYLKSLKHDVVQGLPLREVPPEWYSK